MKKSLSLWAVIASLLALNLSSCASGPSPQELSREYYTIGNAYYELKKYKEAAVYFGKALGWDRTFNQAGYNQTRALAEVGDYEGALKSIEGLEAQDPQNLMVKKTKAYILFLKGQKESSLEFYEQVLKSTPLDADSLYNTGLVAADLGRNERAIKVLEDYRDQGNKNVEGLSLLAGLYQKTKNWTKAAEAYEALTVMDSATRLWWANLADSQEQLEHYDKVMTALSKLETLGAPAGGKIDAATLFRMGKLYLVKIQDDAKALEYFGKAVEGGFNDVALVKELLDTKDLYRRTKIEAFFKEKKLTPETAAPAADSKNPKEAESKTPEVKTPSSEIKKP